MPQAKGDQEPAPQLHHLHHRQKEYKIKNLQTEIDRIVAKEKLEAGLTPGQVSTLARNEQVCDTKAIAVSQTKEVAWQSCIVCQTVTCVCMCVFVANKA
eukprot:scaffold65763_cov21-Tisochrysis_lutea.AAC.2